MTTIVSIAQGGTGANNAAAARNTLGAAANTGGIFTGAINVATANITTIVTGNALTLSTGTASNGNIIFSSNGTEDMRITNTGFIGIFTSTPNSNLTVVGNVWATTGVNAATVNASTVNVTSTLGGGSTLTIQPNVTISQSLTVTGNLIVSGSSTTLNTEILIVEDADIVLLSNVTGTPVLNSGITVNRGTSTNTFLRWSEDGDRWGWTDDGTTFYSFDNVRNGLVTTNTTFATINTTTATMNTATTNRVLKAGDTMTGNLIVSGATVNTATANITTIVTGNNLTLSTGAASNGNIVFSANNTEGMRITAPGNVGIGTNAPQNRFVVSNAGASGFEVAPTGGVSSGVLLQAYNRSTSAYMQQSYYALGHTFNTGSAGGTRALDIDSSGNVGVGTASPGVKLDVIGAIRSSTTTSGNTVSATTDFRLNGLPYSRVAVGDGGGGFVGGYNITYSGSPVHDSTGVIAGIYNATAGVIQFYTGPSASAGTAAPERMRITNSGNVGIGTATPATTLHVDASGGGIVRVSRLGTGAGILQLEADGTDGTVTTTNTMKFVTNGSERMRLDTSGNLFLNAFSGRGGGSTGYLFKLNPGKVYFELMANNTTSQSDILFTDGTSGNYGIVGYDHSNDSLRIYTAATWQMTVDSSGNVGIGTTSISYKLHVNGTSYFNGNVQGNAFHAGGRDAPYTAISETSSGAMSVFGHNARANTSGTNYITAQNSGYHSHFIRMYYDHGIAFHTSTGTRTAGNVLYDFATPANVVSGTDERMRIDPSGNVGIGTASPVRKVHISDSSSPHIRLHWNGSAAAGNKGLIEFHHNRNSDGTQETLGYIQGVAEDNQSAGGIRFVARNNADVEAFRITSAGRVGIGTASPAGRLHVYGGDAVLYSGSAGNSPKLIFGGEYSSTDKSIYLDTYWLTFKGHNNEGFKFVTANSTGTLTERFRVSGSGETILGPVATTTADGMFTIKQYGAAYINISFRDYNNARKAIFIADGYYGYHWAQIIYADGGKAFTFANAAGTESGSIVVNNASVAYNTTSDYRLKENPIPLTGSGAFIDALQPKTWTWKSNGERGVGFIAHEVAPVSPSSVTGEKDAMRLDLVKDEDGNYTEQTIPSYQAMEYGSAEFIANIVAELQSLRARVAALESGNN